MQLNLGSKGSNASPDLMRITPGDLKGERHQSHVMRGMCNVTPMMHEMPWRDLGEKRASQSFLGKCCYFWWTKINTQYICDEYVYCFTAKILSLHLEMS
jgi:hypothetical protein